MRISGPAVAVSSSAAAVLAGLSGASALAQPPGRLSLSTGVPVLSTAVALAGTVYYVPYLGNAMSIYNGSAWVLTTFAELSNVLANSAVGSAGPAAAIASKNYDLFVWSNAGVVTLTRGGAWNSNTARSATTENDLTRQNGVLVNLNAITNGPGAGLGVYVGTVRTDAAGGTVSWSLGGGAAGGTPATVNVWNMYNRVDVECTVSDTTANWAYASATIRAANNSNGNRVSFVRGLDEEAVEGSYTCYATTTGVAGVYGNLGVSLDSTVGASGPVQRITTPSANPTSNTAHALYRGYPGLGFHFLQATEATDTSSVTFLGSAINVQALFAKLRA